MPAQIPDLSLSHGQVLWALSLGEAPSQRMVDGARYLRALGIPFSKKEQNTGRGNRLRYGFDELIELAIAFYYLRNGVRPKDIEEHLPKDRKKLRELCRQAFTEQPEKALESSWVKSRGQEIPLMGHQMFLPYHDRYSETPGKMEYREKAEVKKLQHITDPVTRMSNGKSQDAIPLTRLVLETVAWALEAPEVKTGPASAERKKA